MVVDVVTSQSHDPCANVGKIRGVPFTIHVRFQESKLHLQRWCTRQISLTHVPDLLVDLSVAGVDPPFDTNVNEHQGQGNGGDNNVIYSWVSVSPGSIQDVGYQNRPCKFQGKETQNVQRPREDQPLANHRNELAMNGHASGGIWHPWVVGRVCVCIASPIYCRPYN